MVPEEEGERTCGGDCIGGFVFLGQLVYAFAVTRTPGRTPSRIFQEFFFCFGSGSLILIGFEIYFKIIIKYVNDEEKHGVLRGD